MVARLPCSAKWFRCGVAGPSKPVVSPTTFITTVLRILVHSLLSFSGIISIVFPVAGGAAARCSFDPLAGLKQLRSPDEAVQQKGAGKGAQCEENAEDTTGSRQHQRIDQCYTCNQLPNTPPNLSLCWAIKQCK